MDTVICIKSDAFRALLDEVLAHIDLKYGLSAEPEWVDSETAMSLIGVRSKTTMQELRNAGELRFTQPRHKIIAYERRSLLEYLEKHARKTF